MEVTRKRIVILGGGESGVGAARLAQAKGFDVFLSDKGELKGEHRQELLAHGIDFEEKQHSPEAIFTADEVIKSPGIPDTVALVQQLHERGIPVISEIEFAARYTRAKLVAITGSNGKTTTTLLTYHIFKSAGLNVGLAGNIGQSFARQVIEDAFDWFVLEVSSFQLDGCYKFRPHVAVLLNITPDHLDRYQYDFQQYIASKFRITQNLTEQDYFVYYAGSPAITETLQQREESLATQFLAVNEYQTEGHSLNATLTADQIKFHFKNQAFALTLIEIPLPGLHNQINTAAATLAALAAGITHEKIRESLPSFVGVPHRLEKIAEINGIAFVNDSKATNVDSVFYALGSFANALVLIAGGVDKGNDYSQIEALASEKVKALICLGKDNEKLKAFFAGKIPVITETQSIDEAVQQGLQFAQPGDVVLLSPACASFDLFKNYEDRGEQFRQAVLELIRFI